jgi:hypothetical protein
MSLFFLNFAAKVKKFLITMWCFGIVSCII